MKNLNKGFAMPLIIAIIAVLIGGGVYFYSKKAQAPGQEQNKNAAGNTTADPTAGWKTYTNEKYGFEFKYPQNFTINSEGETVASVIPHQAWLTLQRDNSGDAIEMNLTENTTVDVNATQIDGKDGVKIKTSQIIIGGKKGLTYNTGYEAVYVVGMIVPINGNKLQISFSSTKTSYWENRVESFLSDETTTINQVLSTFKFTK